MFRSTESEHFHMDTAMTGFTNKGGNGPFHHYAGKDQTTPMQDKSSILASKPFIGGKPRH